MKSAEPFRTTTIDAERYLELVELESVVRDYLNEMANPSPCATTRLMLREKMARLSGVEDPARVLRRWHSR